jgi:hypothetical protein
MLQPFPSFLDVSQSFAGRMRDDRGQRFERQGGFVVVSRERELVATGSRCGCPHGPSGSQQMNSRLRQRPRKATPDPMVGSRHPRRRLTRRSGCCRESRLFDQFHEARPVVREAAHVARVVELDRRRSSAVPQAYGRSSKSTAGLGVPGRRARSCPQDRSCWGTRHPSSEPACPISFPA